MSQDDGEKFDPAKEILAERKRIQQEAATKRHEAKGAQLDQFRKQVKLEDTKRAKDTWGEAEAALNQALKSKRQAAAIEAGPDPNQDNGLRTHGQAVAHRRVRAKNTQQAPEASPPLQRTSGKADQRGLGSTGGGSEWEEMDFGSASGSGSPSRSSPSPARMAARSECFDTRSQMLLKKAKGPSEMLADHERRRLRAKVATIMIEVKKRQDLHQLQEKQKKFREHRHAIGRGPVASLGDTTEFALGLTCLSNTASEQAMTSPRRTALLESLTMEELVLMREYPSFFFTGNAISAAIPADHAGQSTSSGSREDRKEDGSEVRKGLAKTLWAGSVDSSVFEDLIEFFSVSTADRNLDISIYAKHLRAQLLANAGRHNHTLNGGLTADVDWRKRLCRSEMEESAPEEQPTVDDNRPKSPLEMMPCLGRHPPIRDDQESPTLLRVRDVYQRRDEQDAKWVDDRREGIARRLALNAFKAREQQRELLLQDFKQKELHKVRMLQAEEKKAMLEYEVQERTEVMGIQKIHRLMVANERAERQKEDKRDQAQAALSVWQEGVDRAKQHIRKTEWEKRKDGERSHAKYMQRLTAMGESRMNVVRTQGQKNDELKTKIQSSLSSQLKEQQVQESMERLEAFKAKQESAALRRHYASLGNRYCFVEKAFGANSVGFDAKHHSIAVDRRSKSWQKNAEAWSKTKGSFSAPVLPPARPLSPGGTLDELGFKTLSESGFKTQTTAVALV